MSMNLMKRRGGSRWAGLFMAAGVATALAMAACELVQPTQAPTFTPAAETPASGGLQQTPTAATTPGGSPAPSPAAQVTPGASLIGRIQPGSVADMVQEIRPSVVHVQTEATEYNFFNQPVPIQGVGTGEIIDAKGYIATNAHVVEDAQQIVVTLSDGRAIEARLVGTDPFTDLAVIQIEGNNLTPIRMGKSSDLRVGESVIAIGHALDLPGGPTVTGGLVSALDRAIDVSSTVTIQHLIQTDAPINPGNSGGPLLNMRGEMVGMNTAKIRAGEGIGFAIAIDNALPLIKELIEKGRIERGYLGISASNVTEALALSQNFPVKSGIIISRVVADSPAAKAGLRSGDILVGMAGRKVAKFADLEGILFDNRNGATVKIEFYRNGQKLTRDITLGARPEEG